MGPVPRRLPRTLSVVCLRSPGHAGLQPAALCRLECGALDGVRPSPSGMGIPECQELGGGPGKATQQF